MNFKSSEIGTHRTTPSKADQRRSASAFKETCSPRVGSNRRLGRLYSARLAHSSKHRFHQIDMCASFDGGDVAVYALDGMAGFFRNYLRDRRAEAYCLRRPVWYIHAPSVDVEDTPLCKTCLLSPYSPIFPGRFSACRWRRSVEHRQAALARPRKYSNRGTSPFS